MCWRRLFSRWRSRTKRGETRDGGYQIHRDTSDGSYHVNVDLMFRDASIEERHDDQDRAEFVARQALLEARVAALEMGSRDDA